MRLDVEGKTSYFFFCFVLQDHFTCPIYKADFQSSEANLNTTNGLLTQMLNLYLI